MEPLAARSASTSSSIRSADPRRMPGVSRRWGAGSRTPALCLGGRPPRARAKGAARRSSARSGSVQACVEFLGQGHAGATLARRARRGKGKCRSVQVRLACARLAEITGVDVVLGDPRWPVVPLLGGSRRVRKAARSATTCEQYLKIPSSRARTGRSLTTCLPSPARRAAAIHFWCFKPCSRTAGPIMPRQASNRRSPRWPGSEAGYVAFPAVCGRGYGELRGRWEQSLRLVARPAISTTTRRPGSRGQDIDAMRFIYAPRTLRCARHRRHERCQSPAAGPRWPLGAQSGRLAGHVNFAGRPRAGWANEPAQQQLRRPLQSGVDAAGRFGPTPRLPTLWIYTHNDRFSSDPRPEPTHGPTPTRALAATPTTACCRPFEVKESRGS